MKVSEIKNRGGFTFADVHDEAGYVGRIVHVMPSDTWRPDEGLMTKVGATSWPSYEAAKESLEGQA